MAEPRQLEPPASLCPHLHLSAATHTLLLLAAPGVVDSLRIGTCQHPRYSQYRYLALPEWCVFPSRPGAGLCS
ncbi:hypothetical protein BsWGS_18375 [Bradybaena similaris]